jgi:predicted O-methyltransferase YrrM
VGLKEIVDSVADIEGWLTVNEAILLANTAEQRLGEADTGETWIEVGSYCGKSTCLLGQVVKQNANNPITICAIDPHQGELTYPHAFNAEGRLVPRVVNSQEQGTYQRFCANLERFGLGPDRVQHAVMKSTEFKPLDWGMYPIGFIFIDGLHDYESVKADYEHFQPALASNALVAFHDDDWEGVHNLITEKVAAGDIEILAQADSLVITRYLKQGETE